jgi:dTDP-glucose 4,6-dehydratase
VALDNFVTGARNNILHLDGLSGFSLIEADLSQGLPENAPFDRVYNLASPASPIDYVELPFETLYVGSHGTQEALERAERDGARLLQASTSEVYGDPEVHPQTEDYWGNVNPIGPRSVYDEAKRYGEALCMAFARYRGVEVRIVRIFNTYGPRMRAFDGRVVPTFIRQALAGQPLTIFGDGQQTRSFCFVSDLVAGLVALMESDLETPCNVGNPHELSMLELAEHINQVTGNAAGIVHRPLPKDDPTRRRPNITKAQEHLGWEPAVPFAEGIAETIRWFEQTGMAAAESAS